MKALTIPFLAIAALLVSCQDKPTGGSSPGAKPVVAAVNYPLAYFAERLAGDFATIVFEAPADEDPAFWEPGDGEITTMQQADVILMNGATYAKWAAQASLPEGAMVDTSAGFKDRLIEIEAGTTHAHGKEGDPHSHGGTAFTTWMDLKQAAAQAEAVARALTARFPDRKAAIEKRLTTLAVDLEQLDSSMRETTAKLKGAPVVASHPVYQYWERAYGLRVPSLLWEPEMELGEEPLADLRKLLEANPGAKFFVWEGDPTPGHIEKLQSEFGLTSIVVSPCGNRPESGDFLSVMQANIEAIEKAGP